MAIQANDCFTSPQIYTLTNEKDKKKAQKFQTGILRRVSDENFGILSNTHLVEGQNHQKELKIEELQNTIVQQQSQFELFKTQVEGSLAEIVEKKLADILSQQKIKDQEMFALTQTVTKQ